jgi:hypothetical protein
LHLQRGARPNQGDLAVYGFDVGVLHQRRPRA